MSMATVRTFFTSNIFGSAESDADNRADDQVSQADKSSDDLASQEKNSGAARDEQVPNKVVVELPKRSDVTEYVVIKCTGAFPAGSAAAMASAAVINKLWAEKMGSGILVPPIEIKQQVNRDGDVKSTGVNELVRKPLGDLNADQQKGLEFIDSKVTRINADVTAASSLCPLQKAGTLGAKCNYLALMLHFYIAEGPLKDKLGAPKIVDIYFSPNGLTSPLDRSWGMRPVVGT